MPGEACAEECEDAARDPEQPDIARRPDERADGAGDRDAQQGRECAETDDACLGSNLEEVVVGVFDAVGKCELRRQIERGCAGILTDPDADQWTRSDHAQARLEELYSEPRPVEVWILLELPDSGGGDTGADNDGGDQQRGARPWPESGTDHDRQRRPAHDAHHRDRRTRLREPETGA